MNIKQQTTIEEKNNCENKMMLHFRKHLQMNKLTTDGNRPIIKFY